MKKTFLLAALIGLTAVFCSCKEKPVLDANGFYMDIDDAKAASAKNGHGILLFIAEEGEDEFSAQFMNTIRSDSVLANLKKNYSLVVMNFTQAAYEKTVVKDGASKAEKAQAESYANLMQKNSRLAAFLNPELTPAVYLLSKEGYFVAHLVLKGDEDAAGFNAALAAEQTKFTALNEMVVKTKSGNTQEKIAAIDEIFEATQPEYRMMIIDLIDSVIQMDKNNESGKLSKYIITRTEYDAAMAFYSNDAVAAIKAYSDAAENPFLAPTERQQSYYMAAYVTSKTSNDMKALDSIIDFMKKAIEAAPDSENVPQLQQYLDYFEGIKAKAEQSAGNSADSQTPAPAAGNNQ